MDIDVGPNAPGSNFSRLERHSADRRIGPASLNHHPNRLCGRQSPHQGSYPSRQRPHITKCISGGRNDRLGYIPQAHSCSPHIHFTNMQGVRSPVTQSTGLRGPASPTGGLRSPRNAIHRCVEPAHNRVGQGPSHHQLKTVNCIASGSGPTVPTQRAPQPNRHWTLWLPSP